MPLNYAIALNEIGSETVHEYVGQEPSGRKHNELDLDYNSKITFCHIDQFKTTMEKAIGMKLSNLNEGHST